MKGGNYHSSDSYVDYDTYNQYLPQQVIDSIQYQQQKSRNYQYQNSRNSQYSLQRFPSYDNFITDENTYYNGSTYYQDTTSYHYNRGGISPNMTYIGSSNRTRKISRVDSHESFASPQNGNDKFRLLPCRTFICTGSCPYGEKCVFLHDPRVTSTTTWIRGKVMHYSSLHLKS